MSEGVRRDLFTSDRRATLACLCDVVGDAVFDGVATEVLAGDGREQRVKWRAVSFAEPHAQYLNRLADEWCSPFLPSFANTVHVRSGTKRNVSAGEAGQFRDPESSLDCQSQESVVTSSGPGGAVA